MAVFTVNVDIDEAIKDFEFGGFGSETSLAGFLNRRGVPWNDAVAIDAARMSPVFGASSLNDPNAEIPRPSEPVRPSKPTARKVDEINHWNRIRGDAEVTLEECLEFYDAEMVKYRADMVKFGKTIRAWEAKYGTEYPNYLLRDSHSARYAFPKA